jgi:hypothetical protein
MTRDRSYMTLADFTRLYGERYLPLIIIVIIITPWL